MAKKERKNGTKLLMKMIQMALLSAIIVVMAYTPIGFLKIGIVEITFITIPVIVGAIVIGPLAGAFLGAVFGTVSFIQCFGMSPFGAAMLGISPVNAFLVCVPTRILMGLLCALIFKAMNRSKKAGIISVSVSSISGALLNTVFFVGTFILLFGKTEEKHTDKGQGRGEGRWFEELQNSAGAIAGDTGGTEKPRGDGSAEVGAHDDTGGLC